MFGLPFWSWLAIVGFAGFIAGGAVMKKRGYAMGKVPPICKDLAEADMIGIGMDVGSGEVKLIPLYKAGPGFYVEFSESKDEAPSMFSVPANATVMFNPDFKKPVAIGPGIANMYTAVPPESLATIGIYSLAFNTPSLDRSDNPTEAMQNLFSELLSHHGIERGIIRLGRGIKLYVTMKIPRVISAFSNYLISNSLAAINSIRSNIEEARAWKELQIKVMREQREKTRLKILGVFLILIAIALLLSMFMGGGSLPHKFTPKP